MEAAFLLSHLDPQWISFLRTKPQAGIFHHPAWSQLLAEVYGYKPFVVVVPAPHGAVKAGVPMMEVNSPLTGRRWVSLPFSDYCPPLGDNDMALQQLTLAITLTAKDRDIAKTELRGIYLPRCEFHPSAEYAYHVMDLEPDAEKIYLRIHEMHRRNIKTAVASNIQIVWADTLEHLKEFYALHTRTRRRQGVPVQPWAFFKKIKTLLLDQGLGFLLLAYKDDACIAGALFLHWQNSLTYKYGASNEDRLKFRPNNLLMWTAIEWGCANGLTSFDLGRSDMSNTGLRTFKSRWGAREVPLTYLRLDPVAEGGMKARLISVMEAILKKSPLWMCRLTGEILYKHFG